MLGSHSELLCPEHPMQSSERRCPSWGSPRTPTILGLEEEETAREGSQSTGLTYSQVSGVHRVRLFNGVQ